MSEEDNGPDELPEFEVPEYSTEPYVANVIAATPSDFSELFPSHRRLQIRHDDSTLDGNMNLRVDTEVTVHGMNCLFMSSVVTADLKSRWSSMQHDLVPSTNA
jgi:hypothetical protein